MFHVFSMTYTNQAITHMILELKTSYPSCKLIINPNLRFPTTPIDIPYMLYPNCTDMQTSIFIMYLFADWLSGSENAN